MGAELEAGGGPGVEVVLHGDGAADALLLADGPELVESGGAFNRGLVDALRAVDVVGAAVALDGAELGGAARRVVRAERLDHVVLDQRVLGPPVHRQVAVHAGAVPRAVVRHHARRARVPPLARHEVAHVRPRHVVRARRAVVVRHRARAVRPERVEEAVVRARARRRRPRDEVEGRGDGAGRGREGDEDGRSEHFLL